MSGKYSFEWNDSPDGTLASGGLAQDGTTQIRGGIYELIIGSEATPADNPFLWLVQRTSGSLGTSTGATANPLDEGDAAAILDGQENYTANPMTLGAVLMSIALNQRATFRWVAAPGSELILAATANNSIVVRATTAPGSVAASGTVMFNQ